MGNCIDLANYISFEINISNHENYTKVFENEKRPNIIKVLFQTDWYLGHLQMWLISDFNIMSVIVVR